MTNMVQLELPADGDPTQRLQRMRRAIRSLIRNGTIKRNARRTGAQSALARHFGVTRQRISQVVIEELKASDGRRSTKST